MHLPCIDELIDRSLTHLINQSAAYSHPIRTQGAVVDGEIKKVDLADFKGSWTVVFFYPKDFTCVAVCALVLD